MNFILNMYFNCTISLQSHEIIIGYLHTNTIIRIFVNCVLHILKWELWKIRNIIKHEHQAFTPDQIFNSIVLKIANATRFIEMTKLEHKCRKVICMLKYFE